MSDDLSVNKLNKSVISANPRNINRLTSSTVMRCITVSFCRKCAVIYITVLVSLRFLLRPLFFWKTGTRAVIAVEIRVLYIILTTYFVLFLRYLLSFLTTHRRAGMCPIDEFIQTLYC